MTESAGEQDAVARTTGRSVLGGSAWYLTALAMPQLYTLAVSIAAARFLGAEGSAARASSASSPSRRRCWSAGGFPLAVGRYVGETMGRAQPWRVRGLIGWAWKVQGRARIRRRSHPRGRRARGRRSAGGLGAGGRRDGRRDAAQRAERRPDRPAALARRLRGGARDAVRSASRPRSPSSRPEAGSRACSPSRRRSPRSTSPGRPCWRGARSRTSPRRSSRPALCAREVDPLRSLSRR